MNNSNDSMSDDSCHGSSDSWTTYSSDETSSEENSSETSPRYVFKSESYTSSSSPLSDEEQGVQGYVSRCKWDGKDAIMKMSNHTDFVLDLEYEAWTRLRELNCIHFCDILAREIDARGNTTRIYFHEIKYDGENDSLGNLIYKKTQHPIGIFNCVRQTLAAIMLFEKLGITHYDLHADNVMITDTPYDVHVYEIDDVLIPIRTFGITPVVIDFGLSYIPNSKYNATCFFAKQGYTTFMNDSMVDCRLLLITVCKDLERMNKSLVFKQKYLHSIIKKFIESVRRLLKPLKLAENGWYKNENMFDDIVKEMVAEIPFVTNEGVFHPDNFPWILELLQHDITLPIVEKKSDVKDFPTAVTNLAIQWKTSVEPKMRNTGREEQFFKDLISLDYTGQLSQEEKEAFADLKRKYPKITNLVKLRRCARELADSFQNVLYEKQISVSEKKRELYSKLECKTTKEMLMNLPKTVNVYNPGMRIIFMNPEKPDHVEVVIDAVTSTKLNNNEEETLRLLASGDYFKM